MLSNFCYLWIEVSIAIKSCKTGTCECMNHWFLWTLLRLSTSVEETSQRSWKHFAFRRFIMIAERFSLRKFHLEKTIFLLFFKSVGSFSRRLSLLPLSEISVVSGCRIICLQRSKSSQCDLIRMSDDVLQLLASWCTRWCQRSFQTAKLFFSAATCLFRVLLFVGFVRTLNLINFIQIRQIFLSTAWITYCGEVWM